MKDVRAAIQALIEEQSGLQVSWENQGLPAIMTTKMAWVELSLKNNGQIGIEEVVYSYDGPSQYNEQAQRFFYSGTLTVKTFSVDPDNEASDIGHELQQKLYKPKSKAFLRDSANACISTSLDVTDVSYPQPQDLRRVSAAVFDAHISWCEVQIIPVDENPGWIEHVDEPAGTLT